MTSTKYQNFTVHAYPTGTTGNPTARWFRSEEPLEWVDARDRLGAAGVIDLSLAGRTYAAGGWMLSVDHHDFSDGRAEPMPPRPDSWTRMSLANPQLENWHVEDRLTGDPTQPGSRWENRTSQTERDARIEYARRCAQPGLHVRLSQHHPVDASLERTISAHAPKS